MTRRPSTRDLRSAPRRLRCPEAVTHPWRRPARAGGLLRHAAGPWLACALLALAPVPSPEMALAQQPPGSTARGLTREERELFLLNAEILASREVGIGVTGSRRATLSDGRLTHEAHIQNIDVHLQKFTSGRHSELDFRDYWGFNVAAYRLDKLLDLGMVPVSVERRVDGERSSVTWWVDGVLMGGREYQQGGFDPPDRARFSAQKLQGWAFQQLIQNRDPNLGNFVIDESWKVWMLDFTRAFRRWKKLDDTKALTRIPRRFYTALRRLDPQAVERELAPYLRPVEVRGLLARRELLLEHFDRLIAERGEAVVLIDRPDR